ncbi:MAG TPA: zinc ribbon domain-containing protein [Gemmatimonas sp.]|uniref:zinc ribbon domain-containing protein n=1 Tax=Gemmatimonas sp. TaxID=1962908 RepID=UPI002EDAF492
MTTVSRSLDDLDRLAFRLSRTVRTQFPHLITQGFTLIDLEERLLPYRDVRREMADSGPDAFESTLLRLVSGERGYLRTDPGLQQASLQALAFPSPTLALVREWATTSLRLGDTSGAGTNRPTPAMDVFPAPSGDHGAVHPSGHQCSTHDASARSSARTPNASSVAGLANVRRATPARGTRATHAHCRFCDGQLPESTRKITFCPHCGTDLTKRQCPACSTELEANWHYCVTCGRGG